MALTLSASAGCERGEPAVCFCCLFSTWEWGHLPSAFGVGLSAFAHLCVCFPSRAPWSRPAWSLSMETQTP